MSIAQEIHSFADHLELTYRARARFWEENMTNKFTKISTLMGAAFGIAAIMAPSNASADGHGGNAATGVKYEKKEQINGGNPIKLEYWEWSGQRAEYQRKWAENYMKMYPNVEIEVVLQPWNTYWPALITNVPAGKGPALWHMHGAKMTEFCDGNLMAPIPASVADPAYLNENWIGFKEGAMACPGKGSIHTVPMGAMMPLLFINTDMWAEAGLTDSDIPKSWDELREVAKKLTKKDGRDRITTAGISMIAQEWMQNAVYQQGRYLFSGDSKSVQTSNPEYKAALQFIADIVHTDKVVDQEILGEKHNGFVAKKAAMYVGFSWVAGFLKANAGDMNWTVAALPTPDGKPEPAVGNIRFAVEAVVNPFASEEEQAVAWDFWHFNYSNNNVVLEDLALFNGFLPPYSKLLDDPKVAANNVAAVMAPIGQFGVINDLPGVIRDEQEDLVTAIVLDPSGLDDKIAASEKVQNTQLSKKDNWNIIERNFAGDAAMIQGQ